MQAHNTSKPPTMRGQLPIITSKAKVNPGQISLEWNPGIDIEETLMSMNPGHQLYGSEYTGVTEHNTKHRLIPFKSKSLSKLQTHLNHINRAKHRL